MRVDPSHTCSRSALLFSSSALRRSSSSLRLLSISSRRLFSSCSLLLCSRSCCLLISRSRLCCCRTADQPTVITALTVIGAVMHITDRENTVIQVLIQYENDKRLILIIKLHFCPVWHALVRLLKITTL